MNRDNNDDGMLLLAVIVKKFSIVMLILGAIGSYLIGDSMGKVKYMFDAYARTVSFDFSSFLSALIMTVISSAVIYIIGEILERVVLCDSNIRIMYEEITKITDGKINDSNENK